MPASPPSPPAQGVDPSSPSRPLHRHPGLLAFLCARTASSFSACVQAVAVGWQIYALTHSTTALALVGLAQFLPMAGLLLPAGHAADHFNRRLIVVTCQCIEALSALLMAVGAFGGWTAPWMIYAMVMVFGAARAFEMPCQQTFLPSLVPASVFPRAAAVSSSLFQAAAVTGPSLGGLLYGAGAGVCYLVCAVGFACACVGTLRIRLVFTPRPRVPLSVATFMEVMHFLRARPEMLGAISLDLFAVLLGGATAMLPVYASDILHAGPLGLGLLRAAPAIGAVLCSVILVWKPLNRQAGARMFLSVALFGVATLVFALSRSMAVSIIALAVLGAADVVSVVVRGALVQLRTPDSMRGRVSAVNMLFIGSSNQLGEFESGMLASVIGPTGSVALGGIGTLLITAVWIRLFPTLWHLDRLDGITPD
ncbi:MFS transporter [Komagataeibacter rhaeticus]|uniref:MFS transporter n=1 Tax=Komagataeibacter rhaeticus TaxID=215221 RepID=UPI0004D4CBD2|nr:MFS transporter [Komagataeibacter rhaeticus]KDU96780.1 MFS transporter [Komagataeibacter rhaeticus AF1]PYD54477.1 MFS transporter [Komagataeibacter rhaeticus]